MSYDPNLIQSQQQQQLAFLQQQARLPNGQQIQLSPAQQAQLALHRQANLNSQQQQQNPNVQAILAQLQAQAQAGQLQGGQAPWPGAQLQQPQAQAQPGAGAVAPTMDINAVAQYIRAGNQLTQEQMAAFTAQVQQQAQRAAQQNRAGGPSQPTQQQQQQQQQQAAIAQQLFNQARQQQQQQQQPQPIPQQQQQQAPAAQVDPNAPRVPYEIVQTFMQNLGAGRGVQQKTTMLASALKNGFIGGGATGQAPTPLTPQQRGQMEKEIEALQIQQKNLVVAITRAHQQYGQNKLNADWAWYQQQQQQNPQALANQQRIQQAQQAQRQQQAQQHLVQAQQAAQHASQQQATQLAAQQAQSTPHLVNPQFGLTPQQQQQQQAILQAQRAKLAATAQQPFQLQQPPVNAPPPVQAPVPQAPPPQAQGVEGQGGMPALHLLQTQLDAPMFMKSLFEVMRKRGEPITGTPFIEGKEVDLYNLYQAVMLSGGSVKINQQQTWHQIARQLGWDVDTSTPTMHNPKSPETTRLSNELAKMYHQLLRPFEEIWQRSLQKQQQQIIERQAQGGAPPQLNQQQPVVPQPNRGAPVAPGGAPPAAWPGAQGGPNPAALANMTPQQLASLGLNAQQIEFMRNQQQHQQAQPHVDAPGGPVRANSGAASAVYNWDPTMEQLSEAHTVVNGMRAELSATLQKLKVTEVPMEERNQVMALTKELIPLVKKVQEVLPCFLAMSQQKDTCRKMLTMASFYTDHLKLLQAGQYALNQSGLEQVRDQFHRIWNYVKTHHKQQPQPGAQSTTTAAPPAGATAPAPVEGKGAVTPKEFSLMAQKNAGLRVEDLKPPPAKHRRMSSNAATSPAFTGSPSTPHQDIESPPAEKAIAGRKGPAAGRKAAVAKGKKAAGGASPAARVAAGGSPRSPAVAQTSSLAAVKEEEPPALKRKRELEEAEADPDRFIERMLGQPFYAPAPSSAAPAPPSLNSSLATDLTAHLPFDFEPALPPVASEAELAPVSFVNAFEYNPTALNAIRAFDQPISTTASQPVASGSNQSQAKFSLDPTLSGGALKESDWVGGWAATEPDAPTPDLVPASSTDSLSPASDKSAKDAKMDHNARVSVPSQPFMTPSLGLDDDLFGGLYHNATQLNDNKLGPQDGLTLPEGFGWDAPLPSGQWEIYPSDSYGN